ncbi:MAG: hypothetical protein IJX49_02500 [Clostridia bacterium]|nr:hypothetical protein [Clostridia bacterium]
MDAKITKKRLGRMLSYDWLKIVGVAAALIFVWVMVFTTTATRITAAQQFTAMNYTGNVMWGGTNKFNTLYNKALDDGIFSYEVLELTLNDLTAAKDYASTVMEARLATDEGDIMFVADAPDEDTATTDKDGKTQYSRTYLESFLARYRYHLFDLNPESDKSYFQQMEKYLDQYYGAVDGWKNPDNIDEAKIEKHFRERVKGDKRFKTEKSRAEGVKKDIARIQKYRDALEKFYGYVAAGYIAYTYTEYTEGETSFEGYYSLNICPEKLANGEDNTAVLETMYEYVGYRETYVDEEGNSGVVMTAKNMNVAFFDMEGVEEGFQYESLLFVNYLLETCIQAGSAK